MDIQPAVSLKLAIRDEHGEPVSRGWSLGTLAALNQCIEFAALIAR
ncbi:MAG: hypothetical protein P8L85_09825 [Rubripirellula sp.]|nr:hypothetical protein [Rubripirellula sp.]